jgi:hypothetical protein
MTPKEKAKELVSKYVHLAKQTTGTNGTIYNSKQCALIAVNLLIECTPSMNIYPPNFQTKHPRVKEYWQEVKKEIEKL